MKKRKMEKALKKLNETQVSEKSTFEGPFSEDPKQMPPTEDLDKVKEFVKEGLVKNHSSNVPKKYKKKHEEIVECKFGIQLDHFIIPTKTWIYDLFTNERWLSDMHIAVAFYYLGVKRKQYQIKQKYATTDPLFVGVMKLKCEMVTNDKTTMTEAASNGNIMNTMLGSNGLPWAEADFVYMPLNIGMHWILLVLDINGKCIRVYDSLKRRGDSLATIRAFLPCLETFLPRVMERLGVYDKRPNAQIGKGKIRVDIVRNCPQQDDGGNCGVFIIKFAEFLMMDKDVSEVSKQDIEMYRQKMTTELLMYAS
ncbi:unnamed protein product [Cuscuta epithymum]|uniref:Ubiquitin-like protease family profile domain-containing protein n=1 Tax=Cuscuta epithymum TaxID=186058 RepID=A0AAV0DKT8_9ASTE|nr:unnamed protein product [Cuscuta epithymum]